MLLKEVLTKTTGFFTEKGYATPRLDTELLLAHALKWERIKLYLNYEYSLSETELNLARELVRRRAQGEPIAYIVGARDFYKSRFQVAPGVLIPRPETEELVEQAVKWLKSQEASVKTIVDLGAGTGCLGLSIIKEIPDAKLFSVDISSVAVEIATQNATKLELNDRANFLQKSAEELSAGDLPIEFGGQADAVVANPPYIDSNDPHVEANVRKFEPAEALFSNDNGLAHIKSWSKTANALVRPGGLVMFEIGWDQGPAAQEVFASAGSFDKIEIIKDLGGHNRFVRAFKKG